MLSGAGLEADPAEPVNHNDPNPGHVDVQLILSQLGDLYASNPTQSNNLYTLTSNCPSQP
eukprot:5332398-Lingulodinium_polyedra.AAC.1